MITLLKSNLIQEQIEAIPVYPDQVFQEITILEDLKTTGVVRQTEADPQVVLEDQEVRVIINRNNFINSMKRNILTVTLTLLITFFSKAQTTQDAFNLSTYGTYGSARYTSMGGAFGSLGGDLSSISDNPAGGAVFLYSEMGLTFEINFNNTLSIGDERNIPVKTSFSDLSQFGFIFSLKNTSEGPFKKLNFGFNIQKIQDFKNNINSVSSRKIGLDQFFLNNAQGVSLENLMTRENETISELYDFLGNNYGYSVQQAFLGFNAYLIDPVSNEEGNTSYTSSAKYNEVDHDFYIDKIGDHKKYSFSISTQYNNSIYIGLNLNSHKIFYQEITDLTESNYLVDSNIDLLRFNNELLTYGSGFSAQLGIIAKIKNNLRLGFSYQSPTRLNLTEESLQFLISDHSNFPEENLIREVVDPQILNISKYKLSTPSKTSLSASFIFGSKGLISAEYSSKNYSNINFITNRNTYLRDLNNELSSNYKKASMLRVGGEMRLEKISFRAGYYSEESSQTIRDNSHSGISFGIGYDFKNGGIIGVSLKKSELNSINSLSTSGINDTFSATNNQTSIIASYNFKL